MAPTGDDARGLALQAVLEAVSQRQIGTWAVSVSHAWPGWGGIHGAITRRC